MDNETKTRVFRVLKKVTGRDYDRIDLTADLKSQLCLDSIQIVELIAGLEKEFDIELPLSIMTVRSSGAFITILQEQLAKRQHSV